MNDTEKYELRIYKSGTKDIPLYVVTSDGPFILPREGELINTFGLDQKQPGQLLKVAKVTHWLHTNKSFLSRQVVNVEVDLNP